MAAVVFGSAAALWIAVRGLPGSRWLPPGALAVCFVVFVAQSVHSYRANTSPLYPTSDTTDFRQGVDYLNRHLRAGDVVVAPKDLAVPARCIMRPLREAGIGCVAVQRRTWVADFVPPGGLGPAVRLEALLEKGSRPAAARGTQRGDRYQARVGRKAMVKKHRRIADAAVH